MRKHACDLCQPDHWRFAGQRAAQGVEKAKAAGKYRGRTEDTERNALIQKHLKAGVSSWNEIMAQVGCSRDTIAKQAALLKAASV